MPSKISLIASIIRRLTTSEVPRMRIIPLPALSDNYMYLLIDEETKNAAIVDPVDVPSILSNVKSHDVQLTAALVTHHHYDHAGGTADLSAAYGGKLPIYAGDARVAKMTKKVVDNDKLKVGNLDITCIFTPCHTSGHICYYVTHNGEKAVFTGDTLFIGGCGRFFEGTAEEMDAALNKKLGSLPDETKVYCGHEYTVTNLRFAQTVETSNDDVKNKLAWAQQQRASAKETVPSTIAEEKTYNPFMRVRISEELHNLAKSTDPIRVMAHIRRMKDQFHA